MSLPQRDGGARLGAAALAFLLAGLIPLGIGCCSVEEEAQAGLPPVSIAPLPSDRPALHFLAIGDSGTGGSGQREVATALAERARAQPVEFVLHLGDLVYPEGVRSPRDPLLQSRFLDVYTDAALQRDWILALGNHDHMGSVDAVLAYAREDIGPRRLVIPSQYFRKNFTLDDGTSLALFVIDTTPYGLTAQGGPQLAWLEQELAVCDARWKIVAGHHPFYSNCAKRPSMDSPRLIDLFGDIFERHGVDLYLAGHDHTLQLFKPIRGVTYAVSGAGAGTDRAYDVRWSSRVDYVATNGGFIALRLSRDELLLEFVRPGVGTEFAKAIRKAALVGAGEKSK